MGPGSTPFPQASGSPLELGLSPAQPDSWGVPPSALSAQAPVVSPGLSGRSGPGPPWLLLPSGGAQA